MIYEYRLRIETPDEAAIDADTMMEIRDGASDHDVTFAAKVGRYLGGYVSDSEMMLRDALSEGWRAWIESVEP